MDAKFSLRGAARLMLAASTLALSVPTSGSAQAQAASLAGTAQSAAGQTLANVTVQLRDLATGQLTGATTSSATGSFGFSGLAAGNYSIEVVNAAGQIIGTSTAIPVAAGATVTGVSVTASAAVAAAAGGAAAAAGAVGGSAAATAVGSAVVVTSAAASAGIVAVVTVAPDASPSQ